MQMNTNFLQFIKSVQNPQQFVINMIQENSNPFFANLLNLGKQGKEEEILSIARNVMKENGRDFDAEFNSFKNNLGL